MAGESPFEKKFVDQSDKADLPGVLDQLTLPPAFIEFVRLHQQKIKIIVIAVAIATIAWALYDSYITNRLEKSVSAFYNGLKVTGDDRKQELEKVISEYKGTPASTWAGIELAHTDMKDSRFSEAAAKYRSIREDVDKSNPLYSLLTYGTAIALEGEKKYAEAISEYKKLKSAVGFDSIGVLGIGRIYEIEGKKEEALKVYEQYISTFEGAQQNNPDKIVIEETIARIRATM